MAFTPRPRQLELINDYLAHGGKMGISAVPGSGKTQVLSALAARLISRDLDEGQEVVPAGHEIDLATVRPDVAGDNVPALFPQVLRGPLLTERTPGGRRTGLSHASPPAGDPGCAGRLP